MSWTGGDNRPIWDLTGWLLEYGWDDDPDDEERKGRFSNIIDYVHTATKSMFTVVEAISAGGMTTPPLIIVKGKVILAKWFTDIHDDD
jgi:uncharacterized protein YgfB (UPF0149 family)